MKKLNKKVKEKGILYKKYEFCIDVGCPFLFTIHDSLKCMKSAEDCVRTAKDLHHWLKLKGFKLRR